MTIGRGPTWLTSAAQIIVTGRTRMVILKRTTEGSTTRTAQLSPTIRQGTIRTVIHSRTSLIDTRTPGLTRLIVTTPTDIANDIDAMGSGWEFACDSFRGPSLDTP